MKIAIHQRYRSFSDRWIAYCKAKNVPYKIVNCYNSNILNQLSDCDGLMWHWSHTNYKEQNFARQLIFSIEKRGLKVFPSYNTCWHFDDKVGQKYLLEAIDASLVSTYVFYDKKTAIDWTNQAVFPKVFKLRGGAGSINVKLVKSRSQACRLINRSFGRGFALISRFEGLKDRFWQLKRDRNLKALIHLLKGVVRLIIPPKNSKLLCRQKGYVYFQDFIPDNNFDDRVVIIGNRAIAIRRFNRINDFRASGSGIISHEPSLFPLETINLAYKVSKLIGSQSMAFDFIYNENLTPYIVEISYTYAQGPAYDKCPGYWDDKLLWHNDNVDPQRYIIEDFIQALR